MLRRFQEGNLVFEFGNQWGHIIKLDEHRDYKKISHTLDSVKGVDFLAILNEQEVYFIEVKDFRKYRIKNKKRLSSGELAMEVGQKVLGTLACVLASYQTSSNPETWQPYVKLLSQERTQIRIVLWLEEDKPLYTMKPNTSFNIKTLKQKVAWLTKRVKISNMIKEGLFDVTVSNLTHY